MNADAPGALWQVAGELETAPEMFEDLPKRARLWMLAWLATPPEGCPHVAPGVVLYAAMGARQALCGPCARQAHLDVLVTRCGLCRALTTADDDALHAICAIAPNLLVALTLCGGCLTNERIAP